MIIKCHGGTGNMDPYVVLSCRTQEKRSSVASGNLDIKNFFNRFPLVKMSIKIVVLIRVCGTLLWIDDAGQGTTPNWNENFVFTISEGTTALKLKIMDSDTVSQDDFVGEAMLVN